MLSKYAAVALRHSHKVTKSSRSIGHDTLEMNNLKESDPELYNIIQREDNRQKIGLELIASENFTSKSVRETLGSCLTNKYAEGYPGARYYGGNEFIDQNENLCIERALKAFRLEPSEWGVNVQALSGSPANFAVYFALLRPHERLMGLDLSHGGHLTHGYQSAKKQVSSTSVFWESLAYHVDSKTGLIDYDDLENLAKRYYPKLIIAGYSAYPRNLDFKRFRDISNINNSYLMTDMAHFSGLVAAGELTNPFHYSDVVTTTTHKTLRGPRAGLIFFRKGIKGRTPKGTPIYYDLEEKINSAVFPGLQGGPHQNAIAGISTALNEVLSPKWKAYARQVIDNSKTLAEELQKRGYKLVTDGTDNHLILVDLRTKGIDGARAEKVLDYAHISLNKNTVPGDDKPFVPGGVRIGSPALTSREFKEKEFKVVAELLDRGFKITKLIMDSNDEASKTMKKFTATLESKKWKELESLKSDVEAFASKYPMP